MSWTDERVELLKKLWMEGLSASQIANELGDGVTRNAVIGKVHRLKLSARAKPASTAPRPRTSSRPAPAHRAAASTGAAAPGMKRRVMTSMPVIGATALKPSEEFAVEMEPELAEVHELLIPEGERLTLLDLNEQTCKWPIGDPLSPDFYFCGRLPKDDHPYCEFHSRRAYHQVDKKRR